MIKNILKILAAVLLICVTAGLLPAQAPPGDQNPLLRRYHEGEKLSYHMKGINEAWHYEIEADGVVIKDPAGTYYEEYRWSNLFSDNQKVVLSPATLDMRQQVTLDSNHNPSFPNLSNIDTRLIGPITDMLTIYADLWLAEKTGQLKHAGDHFYFKRGTPNSWADGRTPPLVKIPSILILLSRRSTSTPTQSSWSSATSRRRNLKSNSPPTGCTSPSQTPPTIGSRFRRPKTENIWQPSAKRLSTSK